MLDNWHCLEEELDVFAELPEDLARRAVECGASHLVDYLLSTLSNVIRITDRSYVATHGDPARTIEELFQSHCCDPQHAWGLSDKPACVLRCNNCSSAFVVQPMERVR
jgi:hypothetical protein